MGHYIYSRVSTDEQDNTNQLHELQKQFPEAIVYREVISGAEKVKPVLQSLLVELKAGDTLVVAALDRLGRMSGASIMLMDDLLERGIKVISVREGIDYSTSSGKLIAQIHFAMAENERNLISERTKKSLQRLKAEGRKLGPPRRYTEEQVNQVKVLRSQGLTVRVIAKQVGLSRSYVGKIIKAA